MASPKMISATSLKSTVCNALGASPGFDHRAALGTPWLESQEPKVPSKRIYISLYNNRFGIK